MPRKTIAAPDILRRSLPSTYRLQIPTEISATHSRLAALEPPQRIHPEVVSRVVVRVLDEAPEGPEEIAHRFVELQARVERRRCGVAVVSLHHRPVLLGPEPGLRREVAEIPHRVVHAGELPVDDIEALARVQEIPRPRVVVAGREKHGRRPQRQTHRFRSTRYLVVILR